jgi:anaerobic ribonucleoside-triphosphate reductase
LSKGKAPPSKLGKINRKLIGNPKKGEKIITAARKEFKEINIDTEKLLKESKNLRDFKKIKKIAEKDLKEIEKYIKSLKNLYGANLNRVYPEIIQLEKFIDKLDKILKEIKKKRPSMNLEREFHIILNEIHKLWEIHKHKISKT